MATGTPASSGMELAAVRPISPPIVNADVDAAAAFSLSKLAGYPSDATKYPDGSGSWSVPAGTSTGQKQLVVGYASQNANAIWITANAAILVPFTLNVSQTIPSLVVTTGGTQSGNFDIGVVDSTGVLKVSKGSTAQSTLTASAVQSVSIGSTVLAAGAYYLALACDNIVGSWAFAGTACAALRGMRQVASAFPLATLTPGSTRPTNALQLLAELT